ncbi:MAG: Tol-Pal system beta propeller repeat protein TolB [Holosporaceae bacterium]|nr:Tol-Pal system beta propeller repeat protein TolB [Holosporaceae bacterium]
MTCLKKMKNSYLQKLKKSMCTILLLAMLSTAVGAATEVEVKQGVMKPVSVALNVHATDSSREDEFYSIVINDLVGTFLFREIPRGAFMQVLRGPKKKPTFPLWKVINAQYLANISLSIDGGTLRLSVVLYDVLSETQVGTLSASGDVREWRKFAHIVANNIYERVVGEQGYFDTKILYVSVKKNRRHGKTHRIAMMDQDGHNHSYLTDGQSLVLTPRFSPTGREFCFFAYKEKVARGRRVPVSAEIYRYNIGARSVELLAKLNGMPYAPRYSPSGNGLIFSIAQNGASSLYTLDLVTKRLTRLTKSRCIDTSPSYSPDGKQIVFNSDRGGTPQLYIMDEDGSNVRRLSFGNGRYATPVWSPRGDWIAFTKTNRDGFFIGIIHPDGSGERMLATGYLVESPTWSPNGRVVMYANQDYARKEKIYSVDITGYNKHEIATPGDAVDPEWSSKTTSSIYSRNSF